MSLAPSSGQRVPVRTVVGGGVTRMMAMKTARFLVFFSNLLEENLIDEATAGEDGGGA